MWLFLRKIHENVKFLFFADHIRAMTVSLASKLGDAENTLVGQLGRHLCHPRAEWLPTGNRGELLSRPVEAVPKRAAKWKQRLL
jgi:hypothetical protein